MPPIQNAFGFEKNMDSGLPDRFSSWARVRVEVGVGKEFTYGIPDQFLSLVQRGSRVRVSFGRREMWGTVLEVVSEGDGDVHVAQIKPLLGVPDEAPLLTPNILRLAEWISDYYLCPMDGVLKSMTPAVVRRKVTLRKRKMVVDPEIEDETAKMVPTLPRRLTTEQQSALDLILEATLQDIPKPVLLLGVTGSGKTEVYLQAIEKVLQEGKGVIFLVPEIALTPQTIGRLRARFGMGESHPLAVLHSGLSEGERFREWQRIRLGEARLVVGARSAIFAPVDRLGLIVVDEEHVGSYKQEENPRYHARDVAVMRGHFEKSLVVLGSATPSMESFLNAQNGKYQLCRMTRRVDDRQLPLVRVVDMRREIMRQKGFSIFSSVLKQAVLQRLDRKEQVILYLNRRGFASSMTCKKCGYVATCPNCSVSLAYHRQSEILKCHFCGHSIQAPQKCPAEGCGDPSIRFMGLGTERLEEVVTKMFPKARVARMDSDTMTHRLDYEKTLLRFRLGKIDILLGTQMISKGLDFPRVTLVGIVHADMGLHMPDFRSGERTFQEITQVAGRAGRGDLTGEVLVQTLTPEHAAVRLARHQNFELYFDEEKEFRKSLNYPPFDHLIKLEFTSTEESKAGYLAAEFKKRLCEMGQKQDQILGPCPAPVVKLRGRYRYHLILRHGRSRELRKTLKELLKEIPRHGDVRVGVDVDPIQMM